MRVKQPARIDGTISTYCTRQIDGGSTCRLAYSGELSRTGRLELPYPLHCRLDPSEAFPYSGPRPLESPEPYRPGTANG